MRRLNGIDADMIYGETPSCHLHVSALLILDPSTAPQGFGIDEWRRLVASQVRHLPPLRERLLEVPFGIDRPLWIEDPHFDLDRHIRHIAVPAPGAPGSWPRWSAISRATSSIAAGRSGRCGTSRA